MNSMTSFMNIALIGAPNCGKTALFNALTGNRQKVANYPGVTVERKFGEFTTPQGRQVRVVDLPGTYSLRARSPDEEIARDVVLGRTEAEVSPDMLVALADATNLRVALRLVLELKRTGRPIVLAVNMMDIARARGRELDLQKLASRLGVPVVPTVAVRKGGLAELLSALDAINLPTSPAGAVSEWQPADAAEIRRLHNEAEAILAAVTLTAGQEHLLSRKIDGVLLHPVSGLLILLAILFVMFQAVFSWAAPLMDAIDGSFSSLAGLANAYLPDGLLKSLLVDGVIAGVGSVLVFLPQIVILFAFIILLEDVGYMARAAFLMDRIMGGVGLHGRSFIPLLSSFACAIPGIMATRVINHPRDRIATILVAPLMACSARLPVYALIIAAFIPAVQVWGGLQLQGLVMFALYTGGIVAALSVAFVLKRTLLKGAAEPLLLELPDYKRPSMRNLMMSVWERARVFLVRAGTIIFALTILLWFLASFPSPPVEATEPAIYYSFVGQLGQFIEPVLAPLGFNWQISVALLPAMAAREVAVAALGTIYALSDVGSDAGVQSLASLLSTQWGLPTALSFLAWFVFAPQCISTLAIMRRETNGWRWPLFAFVYLTALAWIASFATYHLARATGL